MTRPAAAPPVTTASQSLRRPLGRLQAGLLGWTLIGLLIVPLHLTPGCGSASDASLFLDDRAGLLSAAAGDRVVRLERQLLTDLKIFLHTVILAAPSPDLDHTAAILFEALPLPSEVDAARGVLFVIDPERQTVRLEVGYALEGIFPDGFAGQIEREQMAPFFQAGRPGDGIEATIELLVARALDHRTVLGDLSGNLPPTTQAAPSGGAGARASLAAGPAGPDKEAQLAEGMWGAQDTPIRSLEAYLEVLRRRIKNPDLGLFTPESRDFFQHHLVTDAQQDNEQANLLAILPQAEVRLQGELAVIRFPLPNRQAPPYFLVRRARGWMLDFAAMQRWIGFNHKNEWFFRARNHPYMFAFRDVVFDRSGFPHPGR